MNILAKFIQVVKYHEYYQLYSLNKYCFKIDVFEQNIAVLVNI